MKCSICALSLLTLALTGVAPAAHAGICLSRDALLFGLARVHSEVTVDEPALIGDGTVLELFASVHPHRPTWTLVKTWPTGRACAIAHGDDAAQALREFRRLRSREQDS